MVKNLPANAGDIKRRRFNPWGGTIPWQPIPVFLPGESHGQRSLAGYSPGVAKSQTQLTQHTHPDQNLAVMICSAQVEGHGARELTEV